MKKHLLFALTAVMAMAACTKEAADEPTPTPAATPKVTISSDAKFDDSNKANITLTLSSACDKDVTVKLTKGEIEAGKTVVPVSYSKNVTIKQGETSATVEVTADVTGLVGGEYQAAIKISSAEGAELGTVTEARINLSFEFKPELSIYTDDSFKSDKTATITLQLSKAGTKDVVVTLEADAKSTADASFDKTVTIPAGETTKTVTATVNVPDAIEVGAYPCIINVKEATNATIAVASSTIYLKYPFEVEITVDGVFDDWDDPNVLVWTMPEGAQYKDMLTLKLAATGKYVYMYLEFKDSGWDTYYPFDIFIDRDADEVTGGKLAAVDNDTAIPPFSTETVDVDWYHEFCLHDGTKYNDFYSWGTLYEYTGTAGATIFQEGSKLTGVEVGSYTGSEYFCTGVIEEGIGKIEIQMNRKYFKMTGNSAAFGAKIMDGANNWACIGILPQGEYDGTTRTLVDMAKITLPTYVE